MMRRIFTKLERLDDIELPKMIRFEVEDTIKPIPSKGSHFGTEETQKMVTQFIEEYYKIFESSDRRMLSDAYSEDACMSILSTVPDHAMCNSPREERFYSRSRNLSKLKKSKERAATLSRGREQIAKLIVDFPPVKHDPSTFVVDVPVAMPELMHVVVRGLFTLEFGVNEKVDRSFMRSMVVVPVGNGFCISNEVFHIGICSPEQRDILKKQAVVPSSPPMPVGSPVASTSSGGIFEGLEPIKKEMILQFSQHSKLKHDFSKECLVTNNWDFDGAANVFVQLKNENKIPPHYYDPSA